MKKLRFGFTLAEVLITLAIIGVVAAIVMPTVLSSYQYKSVGTKLAKFASTTENAARAYVASNDSFQTTNDSIIDFLNESLVFKSVGTLSASFTPAGTDSISNNYTAAAQASDGSVSNELDTTTNTAALLKDNTYVTFNTTNPVSRYADATKTGSPVFNLIFDPMVSGLPNEVQHTYEFVVTQLGFVYPNTSNDTCLDSIFAADWITTSKMFKSGAQYTQSGASTATNNGCFHTTTP